MSLPLWSGTCRRFTCCHPLPLIDRLCIGWVHISLLVGCLCNALSLAADRNTSCDRIQINQHNDATVTESAAVGQDGMDCVGTLDASSGAVVCLHAAEL